MQEAKQGNVLVARSWTVACRRLSTGCEGSTELLQIALLNQPLDISLTHVELAVLGEVDGSGESCKQTVRDRIKLNIPVFRLDFTSVFQDTDVNEEVSRRIQAASQIDVGPLTLVCG